MLPLLSQADDPSAAFGSGEEELFQVLVISGDLLEEPEFEGIFVSPVDCIHTLPEVGEELGIDPAAMMALPAAEREDTHLRLLEGVIQRLLSDELKEDILKGLNDLRLRTKRAGHAQEAARAAVLHSFLTLGTDSSTWFMVGLVRAIFQRSLEAGFNLLEVSMEMMEPEESVGRIPSLLRRLRRSKPSRKADGLLGQIPGLTAYLQKQADSVWDEGLEAISSGDLYLELFSAEELRACFEIVSAGLGYTLGEAGPESPQTGRPTTEDIAATWQRLDTYLTELFTPARLDRLRARLDALIEGAAIPKQWAPFVFLLTQRMSDEEALRYEKRFLVQALLGEISARGEAGEAAGA
jgi:hypothetical protein